MDAKSFRLDGRIALVTGSSTGIGYALARGLAQSGAKVVLNGRRADRVEQAHATLRAEGLDVQSRVFDVCDGAAVQAAIADIEDHLGPIAILVNNAGMTRRGFFQDVSAEDWHAVMRTNVDSVYIVGQAVARRMLPRRSGRIINICSVMSDMGRPGAGAYTTSKGALKMLTKSMAIDLGPHGITVNGIAPGYFKTELTDALVIDERFNAWVSARTPVGRCGELEDLAPAVVFLASDAASYVNGHLLFVDGGMSATL